MSVACDDGSFSSPKSSQEGVAFPFGRRTRFQTKCGEKPQIYMLRASLVTPPPFGHPLYKQRGACKAQIINGQPLRNSQNFIKRFPWNILAQMTDFHTDLTNLTDSASLRPRLSAVPSVCSRMASASATMRFS